jgi:hypothetical protein
MADENGENALDSRTGEKGAGDGASYSDQVFEKVTVDLATDASKEFHKQLNDSGFFQQIEGLEKNLTTIAGDLKALGESTIQRLQETENLVAHVLGIEAILQAILETHPVDAEKVKEMVKAKTSELVGSEDGSPAVLGVVDDILSKQGG